MLGPPSSCAGNKGVLCMLTDDVKGFNLTEEKRNENSTVFRCCSGFCVDLVTHIEIVESLRAQPIQYIHWKTSLTSALP